MSRFLSEDFSHSTRAKRLMLGQCPSCGNWLTMEERIERWCLACDGPFETMEVSAARIPQRMR